jgi:DNA-binding transcriptional regulator YhcF (GntR family)
VPASSRWDNTSTVNLVIKRVGGVSVRDQLVTQIELQILSGSVRPGQRLPSVRALARQLHVHPNTVAAAYQDLQAAGHARRRAGSGVFVLATGPESISDTRGLDEMIRFALHAALRRGYGAEDIRAAVGRWMAAVPPDRVVVIDPVPDALDLFVAELSMSLSLPVTGCDPSEIERDACLLEGVLGVCLPYHVETLRSLVPGAAIEPFHLELAPEVREMLVRLPAGAIVLVVSHASTVLPFAASVGHMLRGDDVLVEARLLSARREWRRLCAAADLVLADVLAYPIVRRLRTRRVCELRLMAPTSLTALRDALEFVAPRNSRGRGGSGSRASVPSAR